MKMILFASALALGSAAFAQDTMPAPTTPPADQSAPAPAAPDTPPPPAAAAPAETPTPAAPAAAATDDSNLPACSRTVTDKCVQRGGSGHHATMHHAKKKAPK